MERVVVYEFEQYDILNDRMIRSSRKATEDTIRGLKLSPIEGTGVEVDVSEVDSDGFFISQI